MVNTNGFVTLLTSDSYIQGVVALAHSLHLTHTQNELVCLVTKNISSYIIEQLEKPGDLYDKVIRVDEYDSNDQKNLELLGRPELGITFTKLNVWKLVQYDYVAFLDADTIVLKNIDSLFDQIKKVYDHGDIAFLAAPDVGWPDHFNSGVFVCKPDLKIYSDLVTYSKTMGSFDGGDQGLLNRYFNQWLNIPNARLSFNYNVTPSAYYTYAPAYQEHQNDINVVHFIGNNKPWFTYRNQGLKKEKNTSSSSFNSQFDNFINLWWNIYDNYSVNKGQNLINLPINTFSSSKSNMSFHHPYDNAWQINVIQEHHLSSKGREIDVKENEEEEEEEELVSSNSTDDSIKYKCRIHSRINDELLSEDSSIQQSINQNFVTNITETEEEKQENDNSNVNDNNNFDDIDSQPRNLNILDKTESIFSSNNETNTKNLSIDPNTLPNKTNPYTKDDILLKPEVKSKDKKESKTHHSHQNKSQNEKRKLKEAPFHEISSNCDDFGNYHISWNYAELRGFRKQFKKYIKETEKYYNISNTNSNTDNNTIEVDNREASYISTEPETEDNNDRDEILNISNLPGLHVSEFEDENDDDNDDDNEDHESSHNRSMNKNDEDINIEDFDVYGFNYKNDIKRKSFSNDDNEKDGNDGGKKRRRRRSIVEVMGSFDGLAMTKMPMSHITYNNGNKSKNEDNETSMEGSSTLDEPLDVTGIIEDNFENDLFINEDEIENLSFVKNRSHFMNDVGGEFDNVNRSFVSYNPKEIEKDNIIVEPIPSNEITEVIVNDTILISDIDEEVINESLIPSDIMGDREITIHDVIMSSDIVKPKVEKYEETETEITEVPRFNDTIIQVNDIELSTHNIIPELSTSLDKEYLIPKQNKMIEENSLALSEPTMINSTFDNKKFYNLIDIPEILEEEEEEENEDKDKKEKDVNNDDKEKIIMKKDQNKKEKEKDQTIIDSTVNELTTELISESSIENEIADSNENIQIELKDLELGEFKYKPILTKKSSIIIERKKDDIIGKDSSINIEINESLDKNNNIINKINISHKTSNDDIDQTRNIKTSFITIEDNEPRSIILTKDTPSIIKDNRQDITKNEENIVDYENKEITFNNSTEEIYEIIIEEVVQYDSNEFYPREPKNEAYEIIIEDVIQELEYPKENTELNNDKNIIVEEEKNLNKDHYEYVIEDVTQEFDNNKNNYNVQNEKKIIEFNNDKDISIEESEPKQNIHEYIIENTIQEAKDDENIKAKSVVLKHPNEEVYEYEIIEDSYIDESVENLVPKKKEYEIIIEDVIQEEAKTKTEVAEVEKENIEVGNKNLVLQDPKKETLESISNKKQEEEEEEEPEQEPEPELEIHKYIIEDTIQEENKRKNNDIGIKGEEIIEIEENVVAEIENNTIYPEKVAQVGTESEVNNDNIKEEKTEIEEKVVEIENDYIVKDEVEPKAEKENIEIDNKNATLEDPKNEISEDIIQEKKKEKEPEVYDHIVEDVIQEIDKTKENDVNIKDREEKTEIEGNNVVEFENNYVVKDEVEPKVEKENIEIDSKNVALEDKRNEISEILLEDVIQEDEKTNDHDITDIKEEKEVTKTEEQHTINIDNYNVNSEGSTEVYESVINETNIQNNNEGPKDKEHTMEETYEVIIENNIKNDVNNDEENKIIECEDVIPEVDTSNKKEKDEIDLDTTVHLSEDATERTNDKDKSMNDITNINSTEIIQSEEKNCNKEDVTEIEDNSGIKDEEIILEKSKETITDNIIQNNNENDEKALTTVTNEINDKEEEKLDESKKRKVIVRKRYIRRITSNKAKEANIENKTINEKELKQIQESQELVIEPKQESEVELNQEIIPKTEQEQKQESEPEMEEGEVSVVIRKVVIEEIILESESESESENLDKNNKYIKEVLPSNKDENIIVTPEVVEHIELQQPTDVITEEKDITKQVNSQQKDEVITTKVVEEEQVEPQQIDVVPKKEIVKQFEPHQQNEIITTEVIEQVEPQQIGVIPKEEIVEQVEPKQQNETLTTEVVEQVEPKQQNEIITTEIVEQVEPKQSEEAGKKDISKNKKLRKRIIKKIIHRNGKTPVNEESEIVEEKVIDQVEPQKGEVLIEESLLRPVEPQKCEVLIEDFSEQVESQQEKEGENITEDIPQEVIEHEIIEQVEPQQQEVVVKHEIIEPLQGVIEQEIIEQIEPQNEVAIEKATKKNKKNKLKKKSLFKRIIKKLTPHKKDKSFIGKKNKLNQHEIITNEVVTEKIEPKEEIISEPRKEVKEETIEQVEPREEVVEEQPIDEVKEVIVEQVEPREEAVEEQPIEEVKEVIVEQVEPREEVVEEQPIEEVKEVIVEQVEPREEVVEEQPIEEVKEVTVEQVEPREEIVEEQPIEEVKEVTVEQVEPREEVIEEQPIEEVKEVTVEQVEPRVEIITSEPKENINEGKKGSKRIIKRIIRKNNKASKENNEQEITKEGDVLSEEIVESGEAKDKSSHNKIIKRKVRKNGEIVIEEIEESINETVTKEIIEVIVPQPKRKKTRKRTFRRIIHKDGKSYVEEKEEPITENNEQETTITTAIEPKEDKIVTEAITEKDKLTKDEMDVTESIIKQDKSMKEEEVVVTEEIKPQSKTNRRKIIKKIIRKNGNTSVEVIEEPLIENVKEEIINTIVEPRDELINENIKDEAVIIEPIAIEPREIEKIETENVPQEEHETIKEGVTIEQQGQSQKKRIRKRIIKRIIRRDDIIVSVEIEELPTGESTILKEETIYSSLLFITKSDDLVLNTFIMFGKDQNELLQKLESASNNYSMNKITAEEFYNIYITILEELCKINGPTDKRYQSLDTSFMKEQSKNLWNSIANSFAINEEEKEEEEIQVEEKSIKRKSINNTLNELDVDIIYNKRRSCLPFFKFGSSKRHSILYKHKKSKSFDYNQIKNLNNKNINKNKKQQQDMFEARVKYIQKLEEEKTRVIKENEIEKNQQIEEVEEKKEEEENVYNNKEKEEITINEMLMEKKNKTDEQNNKLEIKRNELTENEIKIQITIPSETKKNNKKKEKKRWWKRKSNKNDYMKKEE